MVMVVARRLRRHRCVVVAVIAVATVATVVVAGIARAVFRASFILGRAPCRELPLPHHGGPC